MDREPNKPIPPYPVSGTQSQFFPFPPSSPFSTGFSTTGFHIPPPNITFTSGAPNPGFCIPPPNIPPSASCVPGFSTSNFHIPPPRVPSLIAAKRSTFDTTDIETIIAGRRNQTSAQETEIDKSQIQVHEFSRLIRDFDRSLKKMKEMVVNVKSCLDDKTKKDLRDKINTEKAHLSNLKDSINFYLRNIRILKTKISKRRRKREKKFNHFSRLTAHQIAAEHVIHLQRIATDIEQDAKLKKDADRILSDVLRKKNEAGNRLQLLNRLEKLHAARCNSTGVDARNSGFIDVIAKLKIMWEAQLKEYAMEENGFRTMLEEVAVDRKKESNQKEDKIMREWFKAIFGVPDPQTFSSYSSVDEFVSIRLNWDKHIVEDCDINLKIPVGWVLPQDRCDSVWKKYIC